MSNKAKPKASFRIRMKDGNYLGVTVWPGKTDPAAEILTIQIRHFDGVNWETRERMALYRNPDGVYSALPERKEIKSMKPGPVSNTEETI